MIGRIEFQPLGVRVEYQPGETLYETAVRAGIRLNAVCGGRGLCGRCLVKVVDGRASPVSERETRHLSPGMLAAGYRLACGLEAQGDLTVDIPSETLLTGHRLQVDGREVVVHPDPPVRQVVLEVGAPSRTDLKADWERVRGGLPPPLDREGEADPVVLRELGPLARAHDWKLRVAVRGREVVSVAPPGEIPLGVAVDLGTTKMAAFVVDLDTGQVTGSGGAPNPQIAFGEDVMSRLARAMQEGGEALRQMVVAGLNKLIADLVPEASSIQEMVVAGNTAMNHLLAGLPVRQLGLAPYLPAVCSAMDIKARDLGLKAAAGAYVHLLPNVAGFVGGDHVAMILAAGIHRTERTVFGVDIGTNTEIVLAHEGRLYSASCASGPALEGAHISQGMRAAQGAIEKVSLKGGKWCWETIGHAPPLGICGSGLIGAVGELCRAGLLDPRGKLRSGPGIRGPEPELVLCPAAESGSGRDITLTQADIQEMQLAKGAIRAGMEILLKRAGTDWSRVQEVMVAGAFGCCIDPEKAALTGLYPQERHLTYTTLGNAAGVGARMSLISVQCRREAAETAGRVNYVELMTEPGFSGVYARALRFPQAGVPGGQNRVS